jgi:CheY-like chemotaxis protein
MRILLVEDDDANRRALGKALASLGHEVVGTPLATEGIRALTSDRRFGLILLDMILAEEQTGWLLLPFWKFDKRSRRIPLFVISGMPPEELRFMARQDLLEGVPILTKPFTISQLEDEIKKL